MPTGRASALTGGSIVYLRLIFASLWPTAFALAFHQDRFLLFDSRLVFTPFGTTRLLFWLLFRSRNKLQHLQDLLMGWIQSDQLPGLPVGADLLGTGQDRHDLFIGPLFQQLSLVKGFNQAEGQERGQEVAELASYNGVVILHPGLIELAGGFIEPHHDLDLPALFVGFISGLSGKVQVALQNDRRCTFPSGR